jgi:6-pyruvoyltetrahydropterin/6-carboxytetrahydropterin synthase
LRRSVPYPGPVPSGAEARVESRHESLLLEQGMPGMYEVYVKTHFSAAHRLCGYPGDCALVHGHNWLVEVFVRSGKLNEIGIAIDFRDIKKAVNEVVGRMDHKDLNELPPFSDDNPTSENIAKYLYHEISGLLNSESVRVARVKVCETPGAGAFYWEE